MANRKDRIKNEENRAADTSKQRTDEAAGAEGIEDPAMEAGRQQGRQQGREMQDDAHDFGGQGAQREGSPKPEGTGYTDGSTTEDTDSENPLA